MRAAGFGGKAGIILARVSAGQIRIADTFLTRNGRQSFGAERARPWDAAANQPAVAGASSEKKTV
jgi:hypothetical protein